FKITESHLRLHLLNIHQSRHCNQEKTNTRLKGQTSWNATICNLHKNDTLNNGFKLLFKDASVHILDFN
ncbi:hypothetical protein L9F63_016213, partial [Diploptera punctata]